MMETPILGIIESAPDTFVLLHPPEIEGPFAIVMLPSGLTFDSLGLEFRVIMIDSS